jgi:hypothetical protein
VTDRTSAARPAAYGRVMSQKIKHAFHRYLETLTVSYEPMAQSYRR